MKFQFFEPPLCCSTGVCGPAVDPELVRFAADLAWLERQGVHVERYNLAQQPAAFAESEIVRTALETDGNACLPLMVLDGAIVSKGGYPTREALTKYAKLEQSPSIFSDAVRELVAIGAAIGSNCEKCFEHHFAEARKLGISREDIRLAVAMARAVKASPARSIAELADKHLREPGQASGCCGSTSGGKAPAGKGSCC